MWPHPSLSSWRSVATAAVVLLSASALPAGAADGQRRCAEPVGRISIVDQAVEVSLGGSWRAVDLGEELCPGDLLRSGPGGTGLITLADRTQLKTDRNTTVRIDRAPTSGFVVWLTAGIVSLISPRPTRLQVDTPFLNAAVEGTEFVVAVEADRTRVAVLEGRVRVSNPRGELRLDAGAAAVARAGEAPVLELAVRPRDAVRWALYYPPVSPDLLTGRAEADLPEALRESLRLRREGRGRAALDRLESVPAPERDALWNVLRAEAALASSRPDEAAAALDRALVLDPASGEALALRAVAAVARNENAQALADARHAVELRPTSAAARLALSYAQQAAFDLDAARDSLAEAARLAPTDALVRARLAEVELARGDLGAARRASAEARRLAPDLPRARAVEGFVALAGLDTRTAKAAFARAIELAPLDPQPRLGQGLARIRDGDLKGGRADLELAVALDPGSALLRSYLGKAYLEERRDGPAGDELASAKALDPNDPTPWFYDAIRKQQANRPVEALRNLEEAVGRNDNRAVYRSRLLLDQDEALRGVTLARIYEGLGYTAQGRNEALRAVGTDPANHVAHRLLAHLYQGLPRYEVARASELLLAQLLAPSSAEPQQPSLAFTDLDIAPDLSPARVGFGEFGPLFRRNGTRSSGSLQVGSNHTLADEISASTLAGTTALTFGQFHYETDGFRQNYGLEHDITNVSIQGELTPFLDVQGEIRDRDTRFGDRTLEFDPDIFDPTRHEAISEKVVRLGLHWHPDEGSHTLLSFLLSDRDADLDNERKTSSRRNFTSSDQDTRQFEIQQIQSFGTNRMLLGAGWAEVDQRSQLRSERPLSPTMFESGETTVKAAYSFIEIGQSLTDELDVSFRFGYDVIDEEERKTSVVTPGLGLVWQPSDALLLRFAAGRVVRRPVTVNQSIYPTALAGANTVYNDFVGTTAEQLTASLQLRPTRDLTFGLEATRRFLTEEINELEEDVDDEDANPPSDWFYDNQREDTALAYVGWMPSDRVVLSAGAQLERYKRRWRETTDAPLRTFTTRLPISLRYFAPSRWSLALTSTFFAQDVDRLVVEEQQEEQADSGLLLDLEFGWRLRNSQLQLSAGAFNILDSKISYQDASFRSASDQDPLFVPERSFLVTARFNF